MIDELEMIWKEAVMRETSKNLRVARGPSTIRNGHLLNESLGSYLTSSPAYPANRRYITLFLLLYYLTHIYHLLIIKNRLSFEFSMNLMHIRKIV
jgi:hypothetical protein